MAGKAKITHSKKKAEKVAQAHAKAHGKKQRVVALQKGKKLQDVSTNGIRVMAGELDIPGADTLPRADLEVAIRTIMGVEAEEKPE
jgi:hypothetical protein